MKSNRIVTLSTAQEKPPRGRQARGEVTRARILAVAIERFAAKGYEGTSVDEIVEAAQVNKRMVYHYFENKLGLYQEVLRDVYGRLSQVEVAAVTEQAGLDEVLEATVRASFSFLESNPEFVQLLHWENLQRGRHLDLPEFSLAKAPILETLGAAIRRSVRAKGARRDLEARHLLINLIGLCLIYFSNRYTLSVTVDLDLHTKEVRDEGMRHVIRLLRNSIRSD